MNRREQAKEKRRTIIRYLIFAAAAVIVVAVIAFVMFRSSADDNNEESIQAIKDTILEKSLQCYVIEGAYPESLSYLEENYALVVNKDDYYIVYRSEGENLMPQVTVVRKGAQKD